MESSQTTKPWYMSKGFVGPLVTAILYSLRNLGIVDIDSDSALAVIYQGAEFVGLVVGMAGRAVADRRLTLGATGGQHNDAQLPNSSSHSE
jgi:hypothetical protein